VAIVTATPIVALDFPSAAAALAMVDRLGDRCRFYKIGNELFTSAGPDVVRQVLGRGAQVFLDLKFHDIPNTVAGAVKAVAALGARLTTVHASGGSAMLRAAVAAAGDQRQCGVLAVTVLTSLRHGELAEAWGRPAHSVDPLAEVTRLAALAAINGVFGIVCSGREAAAVRAAHGGQLAVLIPGVRPAGESAQDQTRVVTPTEAVAAGASYIVIGRPVTNAADPIAAMDQINAEVALASR
jgi:orotidine-5'-phosphate decarboxylase